MHFIEINNENGDILYRGRTITENLENYVFIDILTNSERTVAKNEVYSISKFTHESYDRTLKILTVIKNDDSLTKSEKSYLFKLQSIIQPYYDLKLIKLLKLNNVKSINEVEFNTLLDSYKNLIDIEYKKAIATLEELISVETDATIISEINSTKTDLQTNVEEFLQPQCTPKTVESMMTKWPTLLNPSPFQKLFNAF
jgi:hypothetical protein